MPGDITTAIQLVSDKLDSLGSQFGPMVLASLLQNEFYSSLAFVLDILIITAVACAFLKLALFCVDKSRKASYGDDESWTVWALFAFAFSCIAFIIAAAMSLDFFAWIGLFDPKAALVHHLISRAGI